MAGMDMLSETLHLRFLIILSYIKNKNSYVIECTLIETGFSISRFDVLLYLRKMLSWKILCQSIWGSLTYQGRMSLITILVPLPRNFYAACQIIQSFLYSMGLMYTSKKAETFLSHVVPTAPTNTGH